MDFSAFMDKASGPAGPVAIGGLAVYVLAELAGVSPGTIRADFGLEIGRNLVHASDGPETARSEIALWFGDDLVNWQRANDPWIFE